MKKYVVIVVGLVLLAALFAAGCSQEPVLVTPSEQEQVNSCESCHTNKELLQHMATTVTMEEPEEASGEG